MGSAVAAQILLPLLLIHCIKGDGPCGPFISGLDLISQFQIVLLHLCMLIACTGPAAQVIVLVEGTTWRLVLLEGRQLQQWPGLPEDLQTLLLHEILDGLGVLLFSIPGVECLRQCLHKCVIEA